MNVPLVYNTKETILRLIEMSERKRGLESILADRELMVNISSILTFIAGGILAISAIFSGGKSLLLMPLNFITPLLAILVLIALGLSLWIMYHAYLSLKRRNSPSLAAMALAIVLGAFINGTAAALCVIAIILTLVSERL